MVMLGVDAHKATHTIVVADDNGRQLASKTVAATSSGHLEAVRWAAQFNARCWALEDCRHLTRRLERDLLWAGEQVVRVPPKLMAGARRAARTRGKSDPIDALAVARAALREPDLPAAQLDGVERELRLLVDYRETLVNERTRAQNHLRWLLHELDPELQVPTGALDRYKTLEELDRWLTDRDGVPARLARDLVRRCRDLTRQAKDLEREITTRVAPLVPTLLALWGCGPLSAAKIVGETAGVERFRHDGAYAMHNGTAPIPVWSGNTARHRLNRGGNRQLNAAIHRIMITQLRRPGQARDYVERRISNGDTKTEALRALRRQLSNVVYRCLMTDAQAADATDFTRAA
jgi:transposase